MRYVFGRRDRVGIGANDLIVYGTGYTDAWTAAGREAGVVEFRLMDEGRKASLATLSGVRVDRAH